MPSGITVDTSEFETAVREIHAATNRNLPHIVNAMAADVALTAMNLTKKADPQSIKNLPQLQQVWTTDPNTGRRHPAPLWVLYVQKRLREHGVTLKYKKRIPKGKRQAKFVNGVWTEGASKSEFRKIGGAGHTNWTAQEQQKASKRIIDARLRSVGFLRAGFIPAARAFADAAGKVLRISTLRMMAHGERGSSGVAKGGFRLATDSGESCFAELWNSAVSSGKHSTKKGGGETALQKYAGSALQQACDQVSAREIAWAEQHMEKEWRKVWGG